MSNYDTDYTAALTNLHRDMEICITAGRFAGEGRIGDDAGSYIDYDRAILGEDQMQQIIADAQAAHADDYRDLWTAIDAAIRAAGAWRRDCNAPSANTDD